MMSNFDQYKILIVDDEPDIIDVLEQVLKREGFNQILCAKMGEQAIKLALTEKPDIILLDVMLPDLSGHDVLKEIHRHLHVPILFLSAKTEEVDRLLGFALGADDYITKPFSAKEVAFRVKARLKGNRSIVKDTNESHLVQLGDVEINLTECIITRHGQPISLTAKELKLLMYLIKHANKVVSKENICLEVWGEDYYEFDNTISVHMRRLRKKIEADPSNPKYLTTMIGLGYKLIVPEAQS